MSPPGRQLGKRRGIAEGLAKRRLSEWELQNSLSRLPSNHPGAAKVRRLLERDGGAVLTRSGGERKFRALLRAAGLPQPTSNLRVHGFELDLYWPEHGLVVELDSFPFHAKRASFERDRRKDQVLATKGIVVIRITGNQLQHEPFAVIARIAQVIAARAV